MDSASKMAKVNTKAIRKLMISNVNRFVDARTNEINCTAMVEAWDHEQSTGDATLDSGHDAWAIAVQVAEELDG